jgi:hypothetical protein
MPCRIACMKSSNNCLSTERLHRMTFLRTISIRWHHFPLEMSPIHSPEIPNLLKCLVNSFDDFDSSHARSIKRPHRLREMRSSKGHSMKCLPLSHEIAEAQLPRDAPSYQITDASPILSMRCLERSHGMRSSKHAMGCGAASYHEHFEGRPHKVPRWSIYLEGSMS